MENKTKKEVRNDGYDSEEEKEEMKIEKFYSLLRSFREARDRLRRREELHDHIDQNESNKKRMKKTEPCFELQDFTTEIHFPLNFPDPVKNNNGEKKKKEQLKEHALDLKLSLSN
ncbi:uncharacterized protein LOC131615348 [Vicia villosa]|uniref:uncharacterized protein LOC131615348 n=1 Tax=Vicia villosa TaxID=3911 RepID=UPI00273CB3AA|nr:uncharacterized protein LOC131615348 [Vicia villosa]